ncbi:MAG: hypothetical protein ABIK97_01345 [candidate division WOR-3 bacterium]
MGVSFLFAQAPRQDEPEATSPPPSDARVSTDFKAVRIEQGPPQLPIYELRCYTHTYGWNDGNAKWLARACSTSAWNPLTNQPISIYYIDVFGPFCYQQLLLPDFHVVNNIAPISQQFNAHRASLYTDHVWHTGGSRIMRAPSSHMGYPVNQPGYSIGIVPGTYSYVCWPDDIVR